MEVLVLVVVLVAVLGVLVVVVVCLGGRLDVGADVTEPMIVKYVCFVV